MEHADGASSAALMRRSPPTAGCSRSNYLLALMAHRNEKTFDVLRRILPPALFQNIVDAAYQKQHRPRSVPSLAPFPQGRAGGGGGYPATISTTFLTKSLVFLSDGSPRKYGPVTCLTAGGVALCDWACADGAWEHPRG